MPTGASDKKQKLVQVMAITWTNADPDLCHKMPSLDHNE